VVEVEDGNPHFAVDGDFLIDIEDNAILRYFGDGGVPR
jgi:hypothetical protein